MTTTSTTYAALKDNLLREGFQPGPPAQLHPAARRIDRATVGRARCPGCDRQGLAYQPFHKGDRYKVLAVCRGCRHAEEF